jgi:hypothetical protein
MGSGAGANSLLEHASRLVPSHPDLKRVTILAARPDATVVVQADYYSRGAARLPAVPAVPALEQISSRAMTVSGTGSAMPKRISAVSFPLSPLQLYARTQRGFDDSRRSALLDVLA